MLSIYNSSNSILFRERAAAYASQKQLSALSDSLKETLDQAAKVAMDQENERKIAQQHLLDSLFNLEGHVGEVWNQLGATNFNLLFGVTI